MTRVPILVLILGSLALGACGADDGGADVLPALSQETAVEEATYTDISVAELQTMLVSKDFPLVNVHVPFEGDLPETDFSIPFDDIANQRDRLPADRNAKIVLYCRSGSMSVEAAQTLARLGYTNVHNLAGGFRAWQEAGLPMEGG